MSNTCGGIDFLQGGTLTGSTIVNSEILSSVIRASEFNGGHITALASIDDSSIHTIVNGILGLPKEQLIAFATALLEAACGGTVGEPGRTSAEPLLEAFESAAGCSVSGDGAGEKGFSALSQNRGMGCDRLL